MKRYLSFRADMNIFDLIGQDFWVLADCKEYGRKSRKYVQVYSYFEVPQLLNCRCVDYEEVQDPITNAWRVDKDHWYGFYQFSPWDITIVKPVEIYTNAEIRDLVLSGQGYKP